MLPRHSLNPLLTNFLPLERESSLELKFWSYLRWAHQRYHMYVWTLITDEPSLGLLYQQLLHAHDFALIPAGGWLIRISHHHDIYCCFYLSLYTYHMSRKLRASCKPHHSVFLSNILERHTLSMAYHNGWYLSQLWYQPLWSWAKYSWKLSSDHPTET
jgi:hypothetical protein